MSHLDLRFHMHSATYSAWYWWPRIYLGEVEKSPWQWPWAMASNESQHAGPRTNDLQGRWPPSGWFRLSSIEIKAQTRPLGHFWICRLRETFIDSELDPRRNTKIPNKEKLLAVKTGLSAKTTYICHNPRGKYRGKNEKWSHGRNGMTGHRRVNAAGHWRVKGEGGLPRDVYRLKIMISYIDTNIYGL